MRPASLEPADRVEPRHRQADVADLAVPPDVRENVTLVLALRLLDPGVRLHVVSPVA
jgi:hypothetical protein